jgi:hypothetical protein
MVDAEEKIENALSRLNHCGSEFNRNADSVNQLLELADQRLVASGAEVEYWLPKLFEPTEVEEVNVGEDQGDWPGPVFGGIGMRMDCSKTSMMGC